MTSFELFVGLAFSSTEGQQVNTLADSRWGRGNGDVSGLSIPTPSAHIVAPLIRAVTLTHHKSAVSVLFWPRLTPAIGLGYFLEDATHCNMLAAQCILCLLAEEEIQLALTH